MTNDPSISAGQITGYFRVAISHGSANFYIWVKKGVSTKKCPLSPKPNLQWIVLYNTVSCTVVSPFTVCLIKTTHKHWIITQLNPFPLLSPEQLSICAHCCEHCGLGIQCKDKQLKQKDQETKSVTPQNGKYAMNTCFFTVYVQSKANELWPHHTAPFYTKFIWSSVLSPWPWQNARKFTLHNNNWDYIAHYKVIVLRYGTHKCFSQKSMAQLYIHKYTSLGKA